MTNYIHEIKDKKISYTRYGTQWTETAILFFHGFTSSKNYLPISDEDNDICTISFDRPGIGDSDVQEYYSMDYFLQCVNEILAMHNVKQVYVIGHSAGGYYAQVYALKYASTVKSLTLVSSMIPLNCSSTKSVLSTQWKMIKFMTLHIRSFSKFFFKKMSQNIIKNYEKQLQANLKTISEMERQYIESHYEMTKNAILAAVANNGLGVYYDAFALCQQREAIQIPKEIPVFIWNGTDDDTTPLSFAHYLEQQYETKSMHTIKGCGHMMYLTMWKEIISEVCV